MPESAPLRILVVDDESAFATALAKWLRLQGYIAETAPTLASANALLAQAAPDVVISDIHISGNARLEWVEMIRKLAVNLPIIVMTGRPELRTAQTAANLHVAAYLEKPVDLGRLRQVLAEIEEQRQWRCAVAALRHELAGSCSTEVPASAESARLAQLLELLDAPPAGGVQPGEIEAHWRHEVREAVLLLERTKRSFHSKEVAEVRKRLMALLPSAPANQPPPPPPPAAG